MSVPHRNQPVPQLPQGLTPERVAASVKQASLYLRPDIPTCVGHCVYIRRSSIELVGVFDLGFSPGYEEEVDFSQRCLLHGMRHVVADDVFVFHRHAGSFGTGQEAMRRRAQNHSIIAQRYPYYDAWVERVARDTTTPLAHALTVARSAIQGMSATIDGRCLGQSLTGTQLVTLGTIAALDAHTNVHLRVLVPDDIGETAKGFLGSRAHIVQLTLAEAKAGTGSTDVVHRPYQVATGGDLDLLKALGQRLVISQLDNIALRNPGYFGDFDQWDDYRRLNAAALVAADQVVFISRHAADDARILGLVPEARINVVAPGTDGGFREPDTVARAPLGAEEMAGKPFVLCLGTDFLHKNRLFAIRLFEALCDVARFEGVLALAGPKVSAGSSGGEEASYMVAREHLSENVVDLGAVDGPGKRWLLERALVVVYPTTYEGFGLTPFEAADAGTPCVFAAHTSLAEVLPESAGVLLPWDPVESARRVAPLLIDGAERDHLVRSIRIAGARFTSRSSAEGLAHVYAKAVRAPPAGQIGPDSKYLNIELSEVRRKLGMIQGDPLDRALVGPDAVLPKELRRPVLAVATRPSLRKGVTILYRGGYLLRRALGRNTSS